jgi:hypothetical protein
MFTAGFKRDFRMSGAEGQNPECLLLAVIQSLEDFLLSATVQIAYSWLLKSIMTTAKHQNTECLLLIVGESQNI